MSIRTDLQTLGSIVTLLGFALNGTGFVEGKSHAEMVDNLVVAHPAETVVAVHGSIDEGAENLLGLGSFVLGAGFAINERKMLDSNAIQGMKLINVPRFNDLHESRISELEGCRGIDTLFYKLTPALKGAFIS